MQKQLSEITVDKLMQFIDSSGEELRTDSFKVSEVFGKRHDNILRQINDLVKKEPDFCLLNFEVCYENSSLQNGKPSKFYKMTKDGFIFLVMGFTGEMARKIKIAYIGAFNKMQQVIAEENNTYIRQFFQLVEKENQSFAVASMAGQVLQKRKGEKITNQSEMEMLKNLIQPDLFDTNKNGALIGLAASQNSVSETTNQR